MVRGYWGDICNSPYFSFGEEVFEEPERSRFYKKVNYQLVYSNADISEYSLTAYLTKLEELTKYNYPFERIKHLLGKKEMNPPEVKKEENKMEDIKEEEGEEEETKVEEITDE